MKFQKNTILIIELALMLGLFSTKNALAQLNGFVLTPSGTTDNFMKFVPKGCTVNGTNYVTGYLTLSAFKNLNTNQFTDPGIPVQKLQLSGGNILLCRTNTASTTPDINPTSRNGAILFSDMVTTANDRIHGKWGIEYDDQYSCGGLNFFKPVSSLTNNRLNFNLFLSNDGNVGVGTGDPIARLHIAEGDVFIEDINSGIIMKSPDGNCWRGTLNNQGQLEFSLLPDCLATAIPENRNGNKPSFRIVPNPASGYIQLSCTMEDLAQFSNYSLFDSAGNFIKSGRLDSETSTINIRELAHGTYVLNITGVGKFWSDIVIIR
ncbi:MAG: T9SS type A sorting domain-containing protein [Bacteroidota bacterium]